MKKQWRFLFEAFDSYAAPAYLAFFQRDVLALRAELVSVFCADTVRRVGLETALPYVLRVWARRRAVARAKKTDAALPREDLDEYDAREPALPQLPGPWGDAQEASMANGRQWASMTVVGDEDALEKNPMKFAGPLAHCVLDLVCDACDALGSDALGRGACDPRRL